MSDVVGFRCTDGVVICAHRHMSTCGAFEHQDRGISMDVETGQSIVMAHSGRADLAGEAREKIREKIGHAEIPSDLLFLAAYEVLAEMTARKGNMDLQFLVGRAAASEDPTLFEFDGRDLHVADDFCLLGAANSPLLRFMAATMYSPQMNVEEATTLGIYMIHTAEQCVGNHGGPMDIAIMKRGEKSCRVLLEEDFQKRIGKIQKSEISLADLIVRDAVS